MPRISKDYQPSQHAIDLLCRRISKLEAIANIPESNRLTESQIKVMMENETEKMKLYFLTKTKKGKLISRESWELTWVNWMERYYEDNRHKRTDSGSNGFKEINQAYGTLIQDKPVKRKYRLPEPPKPTGERMSSTEAFKVMRERGLIK